MGTYKKSLNSVSLLRMRKVTLVTALCVFMLAAGAANAVTYTGSSPQTTPGQNFIFTFSPVNPWSGGNGTFTVHARGDYSVEYPTEFLNWDIDGLVSGVGAPAYGTVINEFSHDDVEWEQSYTISGGLMNAITSDSVINISVDLPSNINIIGVNSFVEVELTYNASGPPCPPPPAPDNPDPCDGAIDVPVGTCLSWSEPSAPPPPPPGQVLINEIDMDESDAIELYNPTGSAVDMTAWRIIASDDNSSFVTTYTIPLFSLAPGAYVVVHERSGTNTYTDLYIGQNIRWHSSRPGSCALVDATGVGVDFVRWSDNTGTSPSTDLPPAGTNWTGNDPMAPVNENLHSLGRDGVSTDTDNGSDWENTSGVDASGKTPGAANIGGGTVAVSAKETQIDIDIDGTSEVEACASQANPFEEAVATSGVEASSLHSLTAGCNWLVVGMSSNNINEAAITLGATVITTSNFATASLVGIDVLIFYESSSGSFVRNSATATKVANFVSTGGGLYIESGGDYPELDYSWVPTPGVVSTGGNNPMSENVGIATPAHPIADGVSDTGLDNWHYSSHGDFIQTGGLTVVFRNDNTGKPVTLAGSFGSGAVVYSNLDPTYSHGSKPATEDLVLRNVLQFVRGGGCACPTTWDVYLGTDPGGMVLVAGNLADPNYCPGGLESGTMYFWQVIAKNPSGETPGNLWSFETEGGDPPDCNTAVPSVAEIWPPRHEWVDIEILDVNDPDGDPVSITITGITQDEPVAGPGSGRTSPDAMGVGTSVAHVRAERSGRGSNGRVYEISFEADDGTGNTCNGSVKVCVPHDQGHQCVDDGQLYDSTATEMFSADLNGDGIINQLDFSILADYWLVSYELED